MMKYQLLIASLVLLLSSCYSSRKAKINAKVQNTSLQVDKELAAIKEIERKKAEKLVEGKIDSTIDNKIDSSLAENKGRIDSVKKVMDELTVSTVDRKTLRDNYKKIIKSKLVYLKNEDKTFEKRVVDYGFINDVLDNSKQLQFDLAIFFGPGEFLIPADKMDQAIISFTPIVDSMLKFAGKYQGVSKNSTIVLKGYSDATGLKRNSPLFYRLSNELKQETDPSNADLNLALSKLRAASISEVVNKVIQKKQPEFLQQKIVHIELVQEGRGEEKPNDKIQNYTDNDSRRRIVLCFWTLLPV